MRLLMYNYRAYLYAIDSPEAVGGAEKQTWLIARQLAQKGHEIFIAVPTRQPKNIRPKVDGVNFVTCDARHILKNIYRLLRDIRPDWWYWRTNHYSIGITFPLAQLLGIGTIYHCAFDSDCNPRKARSRGFNFWPLYAFGLHKANQIFVQHYGQMDLLAPNLRSKATLIPNILNYQKTEPINSPIEKPYIIWAATLRYPKRPHLLPEIARRLPNLQFVVIGDISDHRSPKGYSEGLIQQFKATKNIQYLGRKPHRDTLAIIERASIFLSTSETEGFPNTWLEAWSYGVPVASYELDPGHVLSRYKLGFVSGDLEILAEELETVMNTPELLANWGKNAQNYVNDWHSPSYVAQQIEAAIVP